MQSLFNTFDGLLTNDTAPLTIVPRRPLKLPRAEAFPPFCPADRSQLHFFPVFCEVCTCQITYYHVMKMARARQVQVRDVIHVCAHILISSNYAMRRVLGNFVAVYRTICRCTYVHLHPVRKPYRTTRTRKQWKPICLHIVSQLCNTCHCQHSIPVTVCITHFTSITATALGQLVTVSCADGFSTQIKATISESNTEVNHWRSQSSIDPQRLHITSSADH